MNLKQIVYSSQPFGFDSATLGNLLVQARHNNRQDGLTGALVCRRDIYLQLLEGPEAQIDATMARIAQDDRHLDVTLRSSAQITDRTFGSWDMLHDPARSWLWSVEQIEDGLLDRLAAQDIRAVFYRLAERVEDATG